MSSWQTAAAENVRTYLTHYYKYCDVFNTANKANNVDDVAEVLNYVTGFVSGAAIYSGNDNLRNVDEEGIKDYVTRYCRAHPEVTIQKMAMDLFQTSVNSL